MTTQKITFTIKSTSEAGPLELSIEKVEFLTKEGNKEVEKILFCVPPSERGDIKNVLESKKSDGSENKTFEIEYDEEDLEIEKDEDNFLCSKEAGPAEHGPKPKTKHKLNGKKELRIWELSIIKVTAAGEKPKEPDKNKDKQSLIEKNIKAIRTRLQEAGITSEQEFKILGNVWETNYRMGGSISSEEDIEAEKKELLEKIEEWVAKNPKPDSPDSPSEPNPESPSDSQRTLDEAEQKRQQQAEEDETKLSQLIAQAQSQTDSAQLATTLAKIEKLSGIAAYQTQSAVINQLKKRLFAANAQQVREMASNTINERLSQNNLQVADLETETKNELEQLKNETTSLAELTTKQEAILTKISQTGVKKELDTILTLAKQVKTAPEKTSLKTRLEKLLINSNEVWQSYISQHKTEINNALAQLNSSSQSSGSQTQPSDLSQGAKIGIGIAVGVGILGLITLLVVIHRQRNKAKLR